MIEGQEKLIEFYEIEKKRYEKEFKKLTKENKLIRNLTTIPGVGEIGAVKLAAIIIDEASLRQQHRQPYKKNQTIALRIIIV